MSEAEHQDRLRSIDIISLMSPRPLWRLVRGMVRAPFDEEYAGSPLAVCWFVNFRCNARCAFCCKAAEIRAGKQQITNEFRSLYRYRQPVPDPVQLQKIMNDVYSKYPLPPGTSY